ncbi:hypothetical protein Tco_1308594 [Tanacetum coccineum]
MSSMGELTFFLGLQVTQKDDGIFISQDKYVDEILKKFGFSTVKTASTPMETSKPLMKDENAEDVDVHLYRSMIGSLMYLTSSRPDIMFVVCACARFQVTPKVSHLHAVKRIFRYLKGQPKLGLWYPKDSPFDLEAYTDSDYAGASLDRKSTTGGCQFLGSRLISWQCKKQTIVANSTTEAEYVAAASCCGQGLVVQVPQPRSPTQTPIADKAASTGVDVRYGRATTTVTSLEAGQGSELMVLCTTLSKKVESLETDLKYTKLTYGAAYTKLIKKVKKLKNKFKSSQARRRARIIVSDDEDDLEDPSKQGRKIVEIDQDPAISLDVSTTKKDVSTTKPVSTAGAVITTASVAVSTAKDKSKAKMDESKSETARTKTKLQQEQETLGYEAAVRLQAGLEEEERQRIAKQLRGYSFDEIKNLFETKMRRVHTFVPIKSEIKRVVPELATGSSKRDAEEELDQESSKRQKTGESSELAKEPKDKEEELSQEELQQMMIIVPE